MAHRPEAPRRQRSSRLFFEPHVRPRSTTNITKQTTTHLPQARLLTLACDIHSRTRARQSQSTAKMVRQPSFTPSIRLIHHSLTKIPHRSSPRMSSRRRARMHACQPLLEQLPLATSSRAHWVPRGWTKSCSLGGSCMGPSLYINQIDHRSQLHRPDHGHQ